jgi:diamine N-acetyltransferase
MKYQDISLRAVEPEDLELLYTWENDNRYWIISNTVTPFSKYTLKRYIENSHKNIYVNGQLRLMIDHTKSKTTIGTIDIFDFDPFHRRAGIGILIANEQFLKKGYGSMALSCLTEYCFNTLMLRQLYCNILASNTESIELFRKHGFKKIGVKKEWIKTTDGFVDEHMFQLLNKA